MAEPLAVRLATAPGADRVKEELAAYAAARAEWALAAAGRALGRLSALATALAEGDSPALHALALDWARRITEGRDPRRAAVEAGAARLLTCAAGRAGRGGPARDGPGAGGRPLRVAASVDVGVGVEEAYDWWARRPDLAGEPGRRGGAAVHVVDRAPGVRLAWAAAGPGGTSRSAVTFHRLGDGLTRVLLVSEQHPRGPVERAARLWGAQEQRAHRALAAYACTLALRGGAGRAEGGGS
ncbi:cyclase/dehydrase [Streptomyces globosus]|uniref:cyclase/dehydrase n=1 Tax=Streptomyces globosus TaxID=68209 RepID=UPI0031D2DFB8